MTLSPQVEKFTFVYTVGKTGTVCENSLCYVAQFKSQSLLYKLKQYSRGDLIITVPIKNRIYLILGKDNIVVSYIYIYVSV